MCFYMFFYQRYQYYPFNLHLIGACCIETSACKEKPGFSHFSHTGQQGGMPGLFCHMHLLRLPTADALI